ncbi:MAG: hypothetical protein LBU47_08300 [Christensenellaceae bacterium]|jgi:putative aldouronate transport system substrate-binding protein|nr:hypothetical protein [Christensenellaceae bacterium]
MKKFLTLGLALLLVLSIAACQSPTPGGESAAPATDKPATSAPAEGGATAAPEGGSNYDTPLTVSMNVLNAEKNGIDVRHEIVKELFNLSFDYVPIDWSDWNTKISTWVATDDAPDLIWWDLKGQQAQQYADWARQGAFAPLDAKYFNESRPNLTKTYESSKSIDALSVDGVLYSWPAMRANPPEAQSCYTSHWSYRRDWAKAVGLYKEGDIYTWDEWVNLVREVLKQDPGGNKDAGAGLVMPTWGFPHAAALFVGPPAAEGNETSSYIKDDSGKYIWPPATEAFKQGVKVTYDMYQEGLIYKDNMLFNASEAENMIKSGLAFADYNVTGSLNDWTTTMLQDGVIKDRSDFGIAIVTSWDGNWYMTQTEDYWTVTALSHKISEEKIERVLDFWEYLHTTDGIRMRAWGREGVDFEVTGPNPEDVKLNWEFNEATQSYVNPFTNISEFGEANAACGAVMNSVLIGPDAIPYMFEERNRLWSTMASGQVPVVIKEFDYVVSFGSAPNKDKNGSFGSTSKEKLVALLAQPGIDIEAEWDKVVASMMPEVQKVLDELNNGELK